MDYPSKFDDNFKTVEKEIKWLGNILQQQLLNHQNLFIEANNTTNILEKTTAISQNKGTQVVIEKLPCPELQNDHSIYANFVNSAGFGKEERIVLILALLPHIRPDLIQQWSKMLQKLPVFKSNQVLPNGITALFLIAGIDYKKQLFYVNHLFSKEHQFFKNRILSLGQVPEGEPIINGKLILSLEILHLLTTGKPHRPALSQDFPAEQLTTNQTWEDYVLPRRTQTKVDELLDWVDHFRELRQHTAFANDSKGYKCLLTGPPGTGKTMLGRLLANKTDREVWRLDISQMVSKYVGETSKNIRKVFDIAQHYDHILFCDEGEGLFSNRTQNAGSAQDTYVNQDVGYLLQAIEEYPGIILVATNNLKNMDDAFMRRFNTRIRFDYPDEECLQQLWQKAFTPFELDTRIDLSFIAREQARQQVTGAQITRVKDLLGIRALKRKDWKLSLEELAFILQQKNVYVPNFQEYLKRKAQNQAFFGEG